MPHTSSSSSATDLCTSAADLYPARVDAEEITEFAGSDGLDAWLAAAPLEVIADAWWRSTLTWDAVDAVDADFDPGPDYWATELLMTGLLMKSEAVIRNFLLITVDRAPEESPSGYGPLGYLGAGPIEHFAGTADIDRLLWIETTAKESRSFREALRDCYWPTERREADPLVAEVIERIKNLP